jgi:hypothetical protein
LSFHLHVGMSPHDGGRRRGGERLPRWQPPLIYCRLHLRTSEFDPEQKSAVVGFRGNRIQVVAGRPWRSTTDKRRLASGNCRPSPGAGHGVLRAAPAGARAADHQGLFRPLAPKAPASRNGGQTDEFSKMRLLIAHRICAARHKFALPSGRRLCSLWLRDLSLIISAPAPWSAREGALPRR